MEFIKVGTSQLAVLIIGTVIFFAAPLMMAIIWKVKKKEKISTILIGAATFLLFVLILEKPIQNALVFPTLMGLPYHGAAQFLDANPVLWALVVGLFPGVFEETGRLVAYKTLLKNRKNRETSISHGIGHGGIEVILVGGISYVTYIVYALMINSGTFGTLIEQAQAQGPDSVAQGYAIAAQLAAFSAGDLFLNIVERIFAVLYHIGASMLVFYACRDKKRFWLYPLAI
ncbi:MAG: YhfC family intramembrane metalloprotease, partial [Lachnospiraceae bacterium]|nr:YhfC family intramembrane metalloprotease [Lachnospiraceae bacterium]